MRFVACKVSTWPKSEICSRMNLFWFSGLCRGSVKRRGTSIVQLVGFYGEYEQPWEFGAPELSCTHALRKVSWLRKILLCSYRHVEYIHIIFNSNIRIANKILYNSSRKRFRNWSISLLNDWISNPERTTHLLLLIIVIVIAYTIVSTHPVL
jgi:hypothetical protein